MDLINDLIDVSALEFDGQYADIIPSLIPNTTMRGRSVDGGVTIRNVLIKPIDNYVMHDTGYDEYENYDDEGNPIGDVVLGYRTTEASCGYNYDFATSQVTDLNGNTVTAYGSREFYAIPRSDVPENQIFDVTNPPEIA